MRRVRLSGVALVGATALALSCETEPSPCDASNAFPIWGKLYDAERDCIDTETHLDAVACNLVPGPDASAEERNYSEGFACLRRLSDGREFWVFAFSHLGFDSSLWERCPNEPKVPPKGCYAAGCTEAPRSSCSLEETRKQYDCTATGEYDENCCGRKTCGGPEDCGTDEQCLLVDSSGQWWCWDCLLYTSDAADEL